MMKDDQIKQAEMADSNSRTDKSLYGEICLNKLLPSEVVWEWMIFPVL